MSIRFMAISISLPHFLVNGEFGDFTVTQNGQRIPFPIGTVNTLEISGDAVKGEGSCAGHELNTWATVVILKQNQFLVRLTHFNLGVTFGLTEPVSSLLSLFGSSVGECSLSGVGIEACLGKLECNCVIHCENTLTLFSEMSNSFYVAHTLWETDGALKDGQVVFTDTTGSVALFSGLVTVTTVKVIVDRFTANVAEELIGIPFGHKLEGLPRR